MLVSLANRTDISTIIYSYRTNLQQLLFALSQSIRRDKRRSRSRSAVLGTARASRELSTDIPVPSTENNTATSEANKKAEQYLSNIKKPNIYIAVYYPSILEEYGLPVNVNVLIREDKHREFKKWIYSTNYRYLEKDLLTKENLRQTLRFLLADSIGNSIAIQLVKDLYSQYPALFTTLLPRSEQGLATNANDDNDELEGIVADDTHSNPSATGCIKSLYILNTLRLPTRTTTLLQYPQFARALTTAYRHDYSMPSIFMFIGTFAQSKKFSFYNLDSQYRYTYKIGDFVQYSSTIVRIDQIFVYTFGREQRLFVKAIRLQNSTSNEIVNDKVLSRGFIRLSIVEETDILVIGLPSISADHLYVVPITVGSGSAVKLAKPVLEATEFIWAQYTVQWLQALQHYSILLLSLLGQYLPTTDPGI